MNDPELLNSAGERLRIARISAGYKTAKKFTEKYNISPSTYSAHETSKNGLKLAVAEKYAKLLNVSTAWLLTGSDEKGIASSPQRSFYGNNRFVPIGENRLDFLHSIHGKDSNIFIRNAGLKADMKVVDVCCYNGAMSCDIAATATLGHVYAFHANEEHVFEGITKARINDINNISFSTTPIDKIHEQINDADFVYCRFLLHNTQYPIESLESMLKILKPGGILAIEEATHGQFFHEPENESFKKAVELLVSEGKKKGVDFNFGNKLYFNVSQFPVKNIHISCAQPIAISEHGKRMMEFITAECKASYIDSKMITEEEIDKLINELRLLAKDSSGLMGYTRVMQLYCNKI